MTTHEVLQEFVLNVVSRYPDDAAAKLRADWPDMAATFDTAREVLTAEALLQRDAREPLKIKRWIRKGLIDGDIGDVSQLLLRVDLMLYEANANADDVVGDCLFEGENGVTYTVTIDGQISPAPVDAAG